MNNSLEISNGGLLSGKFRVTKTSLTVEGAPTIEEYLEVGETLKKIEGAVMWWIGDWLNSFERDYGEKYSQALEATEYEYNTLNSARWVSKEIEFVRRRTNLSWSHHKEVAALEPEEQEELLGQAEQGEWTRAQLRTAVKQQKQDAEIARRSEYYTDGDVRLIEGDVFDVIDQIEDKSIDCLLTDPPYHVMNDYDWDKKDIDFLNNWIVVVKPKLKDKYTGFIFCDARMQYEFEGVIRQHFDIKNRIIWIRKNMSMGRVIGDQFISSYEVIFYFGNKDLNLPEVWGAERFDSFECAVPQSNFHEGKYHPTQKPLALTENLVGVGSYPGETVLDCFAGSGTTGLATRNVGNRRCILIEKDPKYCQIVRGRLSDG